MIKNSLKSSVCLCGILLLLIFSLLTCKSNTNECIYDRNIFIDSTLYISFNINGIDKKFYQFQPLVSDGWSSGMQIKLNDSIYFNWLIYQINFVSFTEKNIPDGFAIPQFALRFYKKVYVKNNNVDFLNKRFPKINEVFISQPEFSCAPNG